MGNQSFQLLQAELTRIITSLPAGSRLPAEPALAKQLNVSRATLREAMRSFETQGLISRRQGLGTFVIGAVPLIDSGLEILESIETQAGRIGLKVTFGSLTIHQENADEDLAGIMNLPVGTEMLRISRVIQTDQRPVAYLVDILPRQVLSENELHRGFTGSVLDLLLQKGTHQLASSRTEIKAIGASPEVARLLDVQRGDVLLQLVANLVNNQGKVIDHSFSFFLPGYFSFHVNRRVG